MSKNVLNFDAVTPWTFVFQYAGNLVRRDKKSISAKEEQMFPLFSFILHFCSESDYEQKDEAVLECGAAQFAEMCSACGYEKFEKYRPVFFSDAIFQRKAKLLKAVLYELGSVRFKSFFNGLFDLIAQRGASGFGDENDARVLSDQHKRELTEKAIRSLGYTGDWPEFHKDGKLSGTRTFASYGQLYTVTKGSPARFFIRVDESEDETGKKTVSGFLCSAYIKRKREAYPEHAFECTLRDGGHRYSRLIYPADESASLDFIVRIAAKTAELENLDKAEKGSLIKTGSFSFPKAAAMFVILGVLFGTLFTTAMMLFDYLESGSAEAGNVSWLTVGVSTGAAFGLMFVIAYAVIYRLKK